MNDMKQCPICNGWPVVKNSGMCYKHHNLFTKKVREFKNNFIKYMIIKEKGEKG